MPEEPRAYEADTYILPTLEMKARPAKDAGQTYRRQEVAGLEQARGAPKAYAISREVILRLIEWFQNE